MMTKKKYSKNKMMTKKINIQNLKLVLSCISPFSAMTFTFYSISI